MSDGKGEKSGCKTGDPPAKLTGAGPSIAHAGLLRLDVREGRCGWEET